ncbi:hypothetical protein HELRODRAFT_182684 [Helobdella robusta]|uniref:Uncharacterized protein n=1 Tax=Helobdella robusta TaxID=6412 RepID=T1FIK9_HELRO|nr:hypothetical protein HELRODRAFT_182684 [Helobdella robusta]ESN90193.1 hypothetical protein HELRODRAFT_182684 [Helobdella robusta]
MFERDLLAINKAGLTDQQAGRNNSSAWPIFSNPEIKCCEEASPGQKRDCLGWRRRLLIIEQRKNFAARHKFTIGAQRWASSSKVLGAGDRHDRSRNETFPNFLGDRAGSTENILNFKYQNKFYQFISLRQHKASLLFVNVILFQIPGIGAEWFKRMKKLVRHHELLKPDKFDGHECLKTFFKKFEICAMYNQWSMDDMKEYLSCSLTGEAAEVFSDLAGPGESLRELSKTVKKLMSLAYPGEQSKLAVHLTRDFFLFALNNADLELKVRNMQDTTENRLKAVERQINALRRSVDVIQDYMVQSAVPRIRGKKHLCCSIQQSSSVRYSVSSRFLI